MRQRACLQQSEVSHAPLLIDRLGDPVPSLLPLSIVPSPMEIMSLKLNLKAGVPFFSQKTF